jgi:hypothetical protein
MQSSFFAACLAQEIVRQRILQLEQGRVGFYSIGLYPASMAYTSAMHGGAERRRIATRPGRSLFGAFSERDRAGMDPAHVATMEGMAWHRANGRPQPHGLASLIEQCDLVLLSVNSNHIEQDLQEACDLRHQLGPGAGGARLRGGVVQPRPAQQRPAQQRLLRAV